MRVFDKDFGVMYSKDEDIGRAKVTAAQLLGREKIVLAQEPPPQAGFKSGFIQARDAAIYRPAPAPRP